MLSLLSAKSYLGSKHRPAALQQLVPQHLLDANTQTQQPGAGGLFSFVVTRADAQGRGNMETFSLPVPALGIWDAGRSGMRDDPGCWMIPGCRMIRGAG